ncbi:hypothetical protein EMIT0P12_40041 [Pseudomonas sp. IT-P12]
MRHLTEEDVMHFTNHCELLNPITDNQ